MSLTTTYTGVGAERDSRTNDRGDNTAPALQSAETARRFATELLVAGERSAVDEFVARVLGQAHQAAHANGAPDEARVILDLAQSFADELAKSNPRFDRLRFIEAATEEPSHA
jgi:hypothetical protein